jgi:hypothetical protein
MPARFSVLASPRFQMSVIVLASIIVVGYLYGANLRAKWSAFDDHEIMWFMGSRTQLPFSEIAPKLLLTEVGSQSDLPRFRPAYYGLRLLETWAWGKHPADWYAAHLSILCFFMITIWALAWPRIGFLTAGLLAVCTVMLPFWSGIFSALGPGETYAVLGLALYLIGADLVFRQHHSGPGWCLLLTGTMTAAGAKENMLLLALPLPFFLWQQFRHAGSKSFPALAAGLGILWCAWIAFTLASRLRAAGGDVYANPISLSQRLATILRLRGDPGMLGLSCAAGCFLLLWWYWRRRNAAMQRAALTGLVWTTLFVGLYVAQVVFYNGSWPTGTRYDFPGMLVWPALFVVACWYIRKWSSLVRSAAHRVFLEAAIPILAFMALVGSFRNVPAARAVAERNVAATSGWTALLTRAASVAREHESYPLVVQSNDPADFEVVVGLPRFLAAYGAPNPAYLLWTPRRQAVTNYLGSMSDQLVEMSENGVPELYVPLARLDAADTRCILLVISGKPRWPCQITLDADWRPYYQ